jgi:hypothetical protein
MAALLVKQLRDAGVICWISTAISDKLATFILVVDSKERKGNKWRNFLRKLILCLLKCAALYSRGQKYSRKQWSNGRKFQFLSVATCSVYNRPTSASMRDFNALALKRNYNTIYCNVFIFFILAIILHSIFSHMLPVQVFVNNFSAVI